MRDFRPAEARFTAPDRNDDGGRDAVTLLDPAQKAGVLLHQRAARGGEPLETFFAEIGAGAAEFGLALGARLGLGETRRREIRQVPVKIDAGEGTVEHLFGNPAPPGFGPQVGFEPLAELGFDPGLGRGMRRWNRRGGDGEGKDDGQKQGANHGYSLT